MLRRRTLLRRLRIFRLSQRVVLRSRLYRVSLEDAGYGASHYNFNDECRPKNNDTGDQYDACLQDEVDINDLFRYDESLAWIITSEDCIASELGEVALQDL